MTTKWRVPIAVMALTALAGCGVFKGGGRTTPTIGDRVPILVSETDAKLDPAISGLQVLLPPATVNADWAQSGGNADKSMGHVALGENVAQAWTANIAAGSNRERLASSPVIAGGKLYVVDVDAMLHAYDASSGASLWTVPVAKGDQNQVYALLQGGRMVARDLTTGQRIWEQNFAGISTPWLAGEWIFVVTDESKLYCLQRTTGKVRWISQLRAYRTEKKKKKSGPLTWYGPVLAGGRLVLTNSLGEVVFVNPGDGAVGRTIENKESFSLGPVVANNTLYTLDEKGRITAYR